MSMTKRAALHLTRHDGNADGAELPIRKIIADAARHGSRGLILAHNHPSGDPTPSATDKRITRRLAIVGEAMDVAILDHIVMAGSECRSMRQMGLL
jgi:DNA repair protein RadC